jgi:hypothetical protein
MHIPFLFNGTKLRAQSVTSENRKNTIIWFNENEWFSGMRLKPYNSINKQNFENKYHDNNVM